MDALASQLATHIRAQPNGRHSLRSATLALGIEVPPVFLPDGTRNPHYRAITFQMRQARHLIQLETGRKFRRLLHLRSCVVALAEHAPQHAPLFGISFRLDGAEGLLTNANATAAAHAGLEAR